MDNIDNYVKDISKNIESKIENIKKIETDYKLCSLLSNIKDLSPKDSDAILEKLLNMYLELLKPVYTRKEYSKISKQVDNITDFFVLDNNDYIIAEGDDIAEDLMDKLVNTNDRELNLPVKLEYIKEYWIKSIINIKDIQKTIMWIILRLATVYSFLSQNNNI